MNSDGKDVEVINTSNFLKSLVVDEGGSSQEIKRQVVMARTSAIALTDIWNDKEYPRATNINSMDALVFPMPHMALKHGAVGRTECKKIVTDIWVKLSVLMILKLLQLVETHNQRFILRLPLTREYLFGLQRARSLPCACAFAALYACAIA